MKILIVDDDETSLDMLENALTQAGHQVQMAHDGREALDKLRDGETRLVISDWEMPNMSGEDLCRAIRGGDLPGYVYIILLTSYQGPDYAVRGMSAGADDFIAKPFHPAELTVRVRAGERILSLETRDVTIFAMAKLAESRDPETGAHLERMRTFSMLVAQHLLATGQAPAEVTLEFVRLIYLTSPLHDIGKVGIPDSVLLKPGRLSDREFEVMKTHTTIGAETLNAALAKFPSAGFLRMARDIAGSHHERCDGSGYPLKLTREQIPLSGRIVALADVYDALTSKRVYKQAFAHDIAKSMILQEAGSHFDPMIIEAFLAQEAQFIKTRERFAEEPAAAA
jgi:putative two-component system response regulator